MLVVCVWQRHRTRPTRKNMELGGPKFLATALAAPLGAGEVDRCSRLRSLPLERYTVQELRRRRPSNSPAPVGAAGCCRHRPPAGPHSQLVERSPRLVKEQQHALRVTAEHNALTRLTRHIPTLSAEHVRCVYTFPLFLGQAQAYVCACSHVGALSAAGARVTFALSVQARQRGDVHHADQRPLGLQPRGRARLRLPRPRHRLLPPCLLLPPDQAHPLLDYLSRSVWTCVVPSSPAARSCLFSTQVPPPQGAVLQGRGCEKMRRAREPNSLVVGAANALVVCHQRPCKL